MITPSESLLRKIVKEADTEVVVSPSGCFLGLDYSTVDLTADEARLLLALKGSDDD